MRRGLIVASFGLALLGGNPAAAEDAATTVFATLGPIDVHGNEVDTLLVGAGVFNIRGDEKKTPAGTVEYRFGRKLFVVGLTLGVMANTEGGGFGYTGIYSDLSYKNIYLTPQLAFGGYHEGDSKDLGEVFQFRMSLDLAYRFANGQRLGLRGAHISNAGIHVSNPGEEEILLTYSFPLGPYL